MPAPDPAEHPSLDRARAYCGLAGLFREPDREGFAELRATLVPELRGALGRLGADGKAALLVDELEARLRETEFEDLFQLYLDTFDASGGLRCPPNETSLVADTASEELTRTYALADVAGFYRAFGVETAAGGERPDHIAAELEFMQLLALKEWIARCEGNDPANADLCRDASRKFLGDHLARFAERLCERLGTDGPAVYATAGRLLRQLTVLDLSRLGVTDGEGTAAG